ncbi:MAG: uracil phosphoribosyltransferase [Cyclobacteriaceae bacterium]|jgi:uracil phosphoribosyltransferase|nr:uracil phosphoribosyltransferase [Cyclobacteriaceae bacterium]
MVHNLGEKNSIANQYLSELRDRHIQADKWRFRFNTQRLGWIMATEISRDLPYIGKDVVTPLGTKHVHVLAKQPVLVTILRAGLSYHQGFLDVFDQASSSFVGAARVEGKGDVSITLGYVATGALEDELVILIDPMLATGRSIVRAVNELTRFGKPRHIYIAVLVAAPEGIAYIQEHMKESFSIWTFAIDEKLDEKFYIVPGLGDAGDLGYGPKL